MGRSTKLVTATYILSYVAVKAPALVTTSAIARAVKDHPARVRQLVAALVRKNLLLSVRGPRGGVRLGRDPEDISLGDICDAVEDQPLLAVSLKDPFAAWAGRCHVHPTFTRLYAEFEWRIREGLRHHRLRDMYTAPAEPAPWRGGGARPRRRR
jgi:Rrf2 family protein